MLVFPPLLKIFSSVMSSPSTFMLSCSLLSSLYPVLFLFYQSSYFPSFTSHFLSFCNSSFLPSFLAITFYCSIPLSFILSFFLLPLYSPQPPPTHSFSKCMLLLLLHLLLLSSFISPLFCFDFILHSIYSAISCTSLILPNFPQMLH